MTATAQCINPGDHGPKASNKQSVAGGGQFGVENGKVDFTVTLTATFQPSCSPPMTVQYTNVVVADTTNNISVTLRGTFCPPHRETTRPPP
ncbi:hypothetical protein ACIBU0_16155 [Streptomyces sp. NPDC049627]|uniref:hypothetical protein n=1 Tax=Streptomyces sp. NPDC049627 TaxID=3365595 RepID=UPI00379BC064